MKFIITTIAVLLSVNAFAQSASELTRDEKLIAYKHIANFLPQGEFRGHILGESKNPFNTHRCVGGVFSVNPESLHSSLRENKAFPLEALMDSYHPNPVGITSMFIDDMIINVSLSDTKVSITEQDRKDGSTDTLEIEKIKNNHAIVTTTYVRPNGEVIKSGCNLDLDKKHNGND